jgi:hypothetical protein
MLKTLRRKNRQTSEKNKQARTIQNTLFYLIFLTQGNLISHQLDKKFKSTPNFKFGFVDVVVMLLNF